MFTQFLSLFSFLFFPFPRFRPPEKFGGGGEVAVCVFSRSISRRCLVDDVGDW